MNDGPSGPGDGQDAPGWAAIDDALARLYPDQVPHQFASQRAYEPDAESPLPAIAVYEARRPDHWHFVTYGLSELFDKSSADPEVSGFGFASGFHIAYVTMQEFARAASIFPIVFLEDKDKDEFRPVVLLGLNAGENLFVGKDGKWQASYVPAIIRF